MDTPFSRRTLLKGAALTFVVGATGVVAVGRADAADAALSVNPWVTIAPEGTVTIVFPSTEMGQGSSTTLPAILAEELDADWDRVVVEQLDEDDRRFGNPLFGGILYTAGSTGVQGYFMPLRQAGAQMRAVLLAIAAREGGAPVDALTTEPGAVVLPSGERLPYGSLAAAGADGVAVPAADTVPLKDPSAFRLIGRDVPRRDIAAKTTGREVYAIDVTVPGMAYAAVARAPVDGEAPVAWNGAAAMALPGIVAVVPLPDGIAVVAESFREALAGRAALAPTWSTNSPFRTASSASDLTAYAAEAASPTAEPATWRAVGDADAALAAAARTVTADYLSDYAYHAQIEPMAAVAAVDPDGLGAEVWAGTQTQSWTTRTVVDVLGTTPDRVRLHMMTMGGGFGRRTALSQEYVRDALLASRATGRPVKVVWTREDDLKSGWFRPAAAQHLEAGLDGEGRLTGFLHRVATPAVIAGFNPVRWSQVAPNDVISMRGAESKFYGIADFRAEHAITERRARVIPWRGIGASYTSFAAEAFMDEVAEAAGRDPIDFRMDLLAENPRGRALLEWVREASAWDRRDGRALGVSFAGYSDSMAAGVAEIVLNREAATIRVVRFVAAVDAGRIVAPRNALAQVEGGIVFGLSSALKERLDIVDGVVRQNNFFDYPILRANELPAIEVQIAEIDAPPTGVGEVGTPMVAAAVANAFHAATGRRLRHLPFTPERVRAALA